MEAQLEAQQLELAQLIHKAKLDMRVSDWEKTKRIKRLIRFICQEEHVSERETFIAQAWFLFSTHIGNVYMNPYTQEFEQNPNLEKIVSDAGFLDQVGIGGLLNSRRSEQFVESDIVTGTGTKIFQSRLATMKQMEILLDMEQSGSDYHLQCDICFKRSKTDVYFLPCNHSFCDECTFYMYDTVHCTICNKTYYNELPDLLTKKIAF